MIEQAQNPRDDYEDAHFGRTMAAIIDTDGTVPFQAFRCTSSMHTRKRLSIHVYDSHTQLTASDDPRRVHFQSLADPYERDETPDSRPTFGLDDGETDGIVLANALDVDGFLTDVFGGTNFPLIHAVLQRPQIVPTPRLIADYARNGHLSHEAARTLIATISPHRSWENSPYVTQLLQRLEA